MHTITSFGGMINPEDAQDHFADLEIQVEQLTEKNKKLEALLEEVDELVDEIRTLLRTPSKP